MISTLLVIAKEPVPGKVKTRLCPPLTFDQASELAIAALRDTIEAVCKTEVENRVIAFEGNPAEYLDETLTFIKQSSGDLADRLSDAFEQVSKDGPAFLVGMDTPQVTSDQLLCFDTESFDACIGMATDGGFWAIGFKEPSVAKQVIPGVPMSVENTGALQLERMIDFGLKVQLLDIKTDFDNIESAEIVASQAPNSRFANALETVLK